MNRKSQTRIILLKVSETMGGLPKLTDDVLVVKSNMVWGHSTREVLLMAENWLQVCQLKTHPRRKGKFNYTFSISVHLIANCNSAFFPEKKNGVEFKRINTILDKSRG